MKKILLTILICGFMLLGFTSCGNNEKKVTKEELQNVNNKIIEYFSNNEVKDYENYIFNYIDEEQNVVVVGLLNNSKEEQEKFKKNIVDSNSIRFVKGEKFVNQIENKDTEELRTFIRTYKILNIEESNDINYIYLTIRQFQCEEVQTVKVERKLCPDIIVGKNYEFTIESDKKIEDNILSIFNNSTILSIKETDKIGLEQIQDSIK